MRTEKLLKTVVYLSGGLAFLLGAAVMVNWHTGDSRLVQLRPGMVPMQYNTALTHAACALGLLAAMRAGRWRPASIACALFALLFSFLTGLQYITGDSYGVDTLFMNPLTQSQAKTAFPGRMAPNSVLCFMLVSSALLSWHGLKKEEGRLNTAMLLAGLVLAFSLTALAGYALGIEAAYGWWSMSNMSPQTAAGFFLEGAGLAALILDSRPQTVTARESIAAGWKPALAAFSGIALTLVVAQALLNQAHRRAESLARAEAEEAAGIVEVSFGNTLKSLGRMQARWERQHGTPPEQWLEDAKNYVGDDPSYFSLGLLDRNLRLYKEVSAGGPSRFWRDAVFDRPALEQHAGNRTARVMTAPAGKNRDKDILAIFLPLYSDGAFDGFLVAAYDLETELHAMLKPGSGDFYHYEISSGDSILASDRPGNSSYGWNIPYETKMDIRGVPVTIRVSFNAASHENGGLVFLIFISGLCVSILLANALYKAGKLRRFAGRLKESEAKLESILENMVDGLITIDDKGAVQSYNKACRRIFGYEAGEVIGRNIKMLMPPHYADNHDQYLSNYRDTGRRKIIGIGREVEGRRKDGTFFPVDLSVAEVKLSGQKLFSGIVRDITERKEAEKQLRRINEELEQFAYIASHDLKAPLRGIDNLAQWIAEDLAGVLTDDTREKMTLLRGRVSRLEMLLEDILQYSRAGRIAGNPVEADTAEMVRQVVDSINLPQAFRVNIPDNMPVLTTSYTPLEQVFLNLISNARKHHDREKGSIDIGAADRGAFYEFTVSDDGPGIPPEFHERIFKMFQTLKPRDDKESSGLGLSIVKKLVEWQGGRVWIVSKAGQRGTTFHFLWPKKIMTSERKKDAA